MALLHVWDTGRHCGAQSGWCATWLQKMLSRQTQRLWRPVSVIELHVAQVMLIATLQVHHFTKQSLAHHIEHRHYIAAVTYIFQHHYMALVSFCSLHHIPMIGHG